MSAKDSFETDFVCECLSSEICSRSTQSISGVCLSPFEGFFFIKLQFPLHIFLPPILFLSLSGHVSCETYFEKVPLQVVPSEGI